MYQLLTQEQQRQFINTIQPWVAWDEARRDQISTQGLMRWHKVSGREYLKRRVGRIEKSLGVRSTETEAAYDAFRRNKSAANERYKALTNVLSEQSRMAVGARLARLPRVVAGLCRMLADNSRWRIVGTNALYAYEAKAGVQISSAMMATEDADVLWDSRKGQRTSLLAPELSEGGFLGLLRKIDKSFAKVRNQPYRAINDKGYMVDLIRPFIGNEMLDVDQRASELPEDLLAQPIARLEWLVSSLMMREVVIDEDGFPVQMVVPDPRAFALHKLWLSKQSGRERTKADRDREQAVLIAKLLVDRMPDYPFSPMELKQFPVEVREAARRELPPGI